MMAIVPCVCALFVFTAATQPHHLSMAVFVVVVVVHFHKVKIRSYRRKISSNCFKMTETTTLIDTNRKRRKKIITRPVETKKNTNSFPSIRSNLAGVVWHVSLQLLKSHRIARSGCYRSATEKVHSAVVLPVKFSGNCQCLDARARTQTMFGSFVTFTRDDCLHYMRHSISVSLNLSSHSVRLNASHSVCVCVCE